MNYTLEKQSLFSNSFYKMGALMIIAYVYFFSEALIGWQDQVYIHINTIKEAIEWMLESLTEGKMVHKEQRGLEADSTQEPLPLFVLKPLHPFSVSFLCAASLFLSANIPLQSGYVQHWLLFRTSGSGPHVNHLVLHSGS